jgi:predicted ATPase
MEDNVKDLHAILYEYLMGIHKKDPNFRFRVRRMNKQNRLEKGYWFNGNEKWLETSFWDYKDNLHQTSVIRLVYLFETQKWACELIGRDSNMRAEYFVKMAQQIKGFSKDDERKPIWQKGISNLSSSIKDGIDYFINQGMKTEIDNYIHQNPLENAINFIPETDFNKDIQKIEKFKLDDNIPIIPKIKRKLPFALDYLRIKNFQGITEELIIPEDLDAENVLANAQWIFLTGENGFGKTSILKAIAIGLTEDEDKHLLQDINYDNEIRAYQNTTLLEYDYTKREDDIKNEFKIVAYGVSRFLLNKQNLNGVKTTRTASLFFDEAVLIDIEKRVIDAYKEQDNELKNGIIERNTTFFKLKTIIKKAIPNLADIEVKYDPLLPFDDRYYVLYHENDKDLNKKNELQLKYYAPVKLKDLAAGYRSILIMIGDMVIRLSDNLQSSVEDISGVVIIDEVDAHLHPKYQYELPKLLSDAFPKVQFIVSTHSPIPLLGLPKDINKVVLKVNRTVENGITVDRLDDDIDIYRLNPNALLTSPIFGFTHLFANGVKEEEITPINNFEEWEDIYEELEQLKTEGKL